MVSSLKLLKLMLTVLNVYFIYKFSTTTHSCRAVILAVAFSIPSEPHNADAASRNGAESKAATQTHSVYFLGYTINQQGRCN